MYGAEPGNSRLYAYMDGLTTVTDGTVPDGKSFVYHFNDQGNVVSVHDMNGMATFASYSGVAPKHRPIFISRVQSASRNLLTNHSFDADTGWTLSGDAVAYAAGNQMYGTRCLAFVNPPVAIVQRAYQPVSVDEGGAYTLSLHAKRSGDMNFAVHCLYKDAQNNAQILKSGALQAEIGSAYTRLSHTFVLPTDMTAQDICIELVAQSTDGTSASLYIDCVQLEPGYVENQYNLLSNTEFARTTESGLPEGWTLAQTTPEDTIYAIASDESAPETLPKQAMRLHGQGAATLAIYQELPISGLRGDTFVAGGWSKGYSLPRGSAKNRYNIRVAFKSGNKYIDTPEVQWSDEWSLWQFACGAVEAPANYTAICFLIDYNSNCNHADFTSLFLYKESCGWHYTYDAKGNMLSAKDTTGKTRFAAYDAYNNMVSYQPAGQPTTVKMLMTYGSTAADYMRHLVRTVKSPMGYMQSFTYDTAGNKTTSKLLSTDQKENMQSETRYRADKNHAYAQIDARGQVHVQQVNPITGDPLFAANDLGIKMMWGFDQDQKVYSAHRSMQDYVVRNHAQYSDDMERLLETKHHVDDANNVQYHFEYDAMGNVVKSHIGDTLYASTTYTETGDKLPIQVELGNGCSTAYERDAFKRVIGTRYDADTQARHINHYDGTGKVTKVTDNALGRTLHKTFDPAGRPLRIKETEDGNMLFMGTVEYDAFNRVSRRTEMIADGRTYETKFAYDLEGKKTEILLGDSGAKVQYAYDKLGRASTVTRKGISGDHVTRYTYCTGGFGDGSSTLLLASVSQPDGDTHYTYDGENRVKQETKNDLSIAYTYDPFGQLLRVDDEHTMQSCTFHYDAGGNLLRKTEHAYAKGAPGAPTRTIDYRYEDANWKDKLTQYDGASISYDAIGNVTQDGTWTYRYAMGRFLAAMDSSADALSFAYNAGGLRVIKESREHGETHYTYNGTNIVHMQNGDIDLHFWHSEDGKPKMVSFEGNNYYYVYNAYGDVVALLDERHGCTPVVTYRYDAWGLPLAIEGSMASTLGAHNPFRYRGYVYDAETGLYYLGGRYYNPTWGRFISGDSLGNQRGTGAHNNLFSYCGNKPVQLTDPSAVLLYGSSFLSAVPVSLKW